MFLFILIYLYKNFFPVVEYVYFETYGNLKTCWFYYTRFKQDILDKAYQSFRLGIKGGPLLLSDNLGFRCNCGWGPVGSTEVDESRESIAMA